MRRRTRRAPDRAGDAPQLLEEGAAWILGRPLSEAERDATRKYLLLLAKWQRAQRLVGSAAPEWLVIHVVLDSLLFLRVLPAAARRVLDLGAGAGVPGVPLRIVRPDLEVTLLEARRRRASFLAEVVRELGLANCRVVGERAEAVASEIGATFDAVVMRCAGSPEDMVPLALRFVSPGGRVVVSGPPHRSSGALGDWVEVEGARPGETRRFLVAMKPPDSGG